MSEDHGALLRLMRDASERFVTARATIREWRDEKTTDWVHERMVETEAYRKIFGPPEKRGEALPHHREDFEQTWRVWHERPDRWRQEIEPSDGSGTEYRVVDGDDFWAYSPRFGPRHAVSRRTEYGGGFAPEFEIAHVFDSLPGYVSCQVCKSSRVAPCLLPCHQLRLFGHRSLLPLQLR